MIFIRYIIFLIFNIFIFLENRSVYILEKILFDDFRYLANGIIHKSQQSEDLLSNFMKADKLNNMKKMIDNAEKSYDLETKVFKMIKDSYNKLKSKRRYNLIIGDKLIFRNSYNIYGKYEIDDIIYFKLEDLETEKIYLEKYFNTINDNLSITRKEKFIELIYKKLIPVKNIKFIYFQQGYFLT